MIIFSYKKNNTGKKAFALVFAVLSGSIMATIALIMVNLVEKEIRLASFAEKSRIAFFAADAGIECALFLDIQKTMFPLSGANNPVGTNIASTMPCQVETQPIIVSYDQTGGGERNITLHTPLQRARAVNTDPVVIDGCSIIRIKKTAATTQIQSFGLNRMWSEGLQRCVSVKDGVERAIETTYLH